MKTCMLCVLHVYPQIFHLWAKITLQAHHSLNTFQFLLVERMLLTNPLKRERGSRLIDRRSNRDGKDFSLNASLSLSLSLFVLLFNIIVQSPNSLSWQQENTFHLRSGGFNLSSQRPSSYSSRWNMNKAPTFWIDLAWLSSQVPSRWPAPCNFHWVLCALQIQTIAKPTAGFISRGCKASCGQNSVQDTTMQTSSTFIEHFILWGSNTKLGLFTKESLVQKKQ